MYFLYLCSWQCYSPSPGLKDNAITPREGCRRRGGFVNLPKSNCVPECSKPVYDSSPFMDVYIYIRPYRKPRVSIIKCMDVYRHKDNTKTVSKIQRISDLYTRIHTGVIFLWVCAVWHPEFFPKTRMNEIPKRWIAKKSCKQTAQEQIEVVFPALKFISARKER